MIGPTPPRKVVLVLLQRVELASVYTKPLLAMFKEVSRFVWTYTRGETVVESAFLAPLFPTDDLRRQRRVDWARTQQILRTDEWWDGPRRRLFKVDQERLLPRVRDLIGAESDEHVIAVIGANLTPPPAWSYRLWEEIDPWSAAIGLSPMSPSYWGDDDPDDRMRLVTTVVARARAATCAVIGRQLRLKTCSNPHCFLFHPVTSVMELDVMRGFGREHGEPLPLTPVIANVAAMAAFDGAPEML